MTDQNVEMNDVISLTPEGHIMHAVRTQQLNNTKRLEMIERKIYHLIDQLNRIESRQRGIRVD